MKGKGNKNGLGFLKALSVTFLKRKKKAENEALSKAVEYSNGMTATDGDRAYKSGYSFFEVSDADKPAKMPGIKGSNTVALIDRLRDLQVKFSDTKEIDDGYQWDGINAGVHCYLTANKKFEIASLEISSFAKQKNDELIGCCLSIYYATSNAERVLKHFGENRSSKIEVGDALFELHENESGIILTVKACGFDKYVASLMS